MPYYAHPSPLVAASRRLQCAIDTARVATHRSPALENLVEECVRVLETLKSAADEERFPPRQLGRRMAELRRLNRALREEVSHHQAVRLALQGTYARLQFLVSATPVMLYRCQPGGDYAITYVSNNVLAQLGYEPAEITGDAGFWIGRIHPDDAPRVLADLAAMPEKGHDSREYRFLHRDGGYRWLRDENSMILDARGEPLEIVGYWINITKRKKAEEALQESERFAHAVIDSLSANLCVLDEEGRIVAANKAWREFAAANGARPEDVGKGNSYLAVCDAAAASSSFAAEFGAGIRSVLSGARAGFSMEYECRSPAQQQWFVAKVTRFPDLGPVRVVIAHENITERKLAELALRQGEERLNSILSSLNDVIWSLSGEDYRLLYLNPAAERLYGHAPRDFFADKDLWLRVIHPEDRERVMANLPEFLEQGTCELEYRIVRPDGSVRWVRDRGRVIHDEAGKTVRLDGIVTDITELKRAQEALRDNASRLQRLTAHLESVREEQSARIAREVHDELGGTLTVVRLGLASLLEKASALPRVREQVESMLKLSDTAIQTVKRVSSSLRPSMLDTLGLVATIKWHAAEFSRLTGIDTALQLPEYVRLSRERGIAVYRIIQEALTNVARHAEASRVSINVRKHKGNLIVEIVDNGKGVTEVNMNQAESYGILGMRERTQYLGGELAIRPNGDRGTSLSLRLPLDR